MNIQLLPGSLIPTAGDLSNGFYPYLRKFGMDDPEFLDILSWLQSKGAPAFLLNVYANMQGQKMPTQIIWDDGKGKALEMDAAIVYNFPHVALVDLKAYFEFGNPMITELYAGYRAPAKFVSVPVMGAAWPEESEARGVPCFHTVPHDGLNDGATYIDSKGSYLKVGRKFAFFTIESVWVKQ